MKKGTILFAAVLAVIFIAEGILSFANFAKNFISVSSLTERPDTQYDPELGWTNKPKVRTEKAFFLNKKLTTNSLGFRGEKEFSPVPSKEKSRVICSGDSFTFGNEVNDEETWCSLLETLGTDLESANLGERGYGIDQSFLKFQRYRHTLRHSTHVFAFITNDFERMKHSQFTGYPKPLLVSQNGKVNIRNFPIPRLEEHNRYRWMEALTDLHLGGLFWRVRSYIGNEKSLTQTEALGILEGIIRELKEIEPQHQTLYLHLPAGIDFLDSQSDFLRAWFREREEKNGIEYLDLIGDFKKMGIATAQQLFTGSLGNTHYSPAGHTWVAHKVLEKMTKEVHLNL